MASALVKVEPSLKLTKVEEDAMFSAVAEGNLAKLTKQQQLAYYYRRCNDLGLNPLNQPFNWLQLQGKLTLYANRACTEELRATRKISLSVVSREFADDCYVVTVKASTPDGRVDENIGAVNIAGLKGEAKANAMMKAHTKACRRATLSICGLGVLDELEVSTIPGAKTLEMAAADYEKSSPYAANIEKAEAQVQAEESVELSDQSADVSSPQPEVIESNEEFEISAKLVSAKPANNGVWLEFPKFRAAVTSEKWVKFLHDKGVEAGWNLEMVCTSIMVEGVEHWKVVVIKSATPGQTDLEKQLAASVEQVKNKKKA